MAVNRAIDIKVTANTGAAEAGLAATEKKVGAVTSAVGGLGRGFESRPVNVRVHEVAEDVDVQPVPVPLESLR